MYCSINWVWPRPRERASSCRPSYRSRGSRTEVGTFGGVDGAGTGSGRACSSRPLRSVLSRSISGSRIAVSSRSSSVLDLLIVELARGDDVPDVGLTVGLLRQEADPPSGGGLPGHEPRPRPERDEHPPIGSDDLPQFSRCDPVLLAVG